MIPPLANVRKIAHLVVHAIDGYFAVYVGSLAKYAVHARFYIVVRRKY